MLKDLVFEVTRHRSLLQAVAKTRSDFGLMIDALASEDLKHRRTDPSLEE